MPVIGCLDLPAWPHHFCICFAVRHAHSDAESFAETECRGLCLGLGFHGKHVGRVADASNLLVIATEPNKTLL